MIIRNIMNIQYYGDFCFKISTKPAGRATEDVVIWTDPLAKGSGLRAPQGQVHLVFFSHRNEEVRETFEKDTLVFDTPGEYAAKGVAALGFATYRDTEEGNERGQNVIFVFDSEDLHICYLGALGHGLSPEMLDKLNGVDVLFVPVGGSDTLNAQAAAELVRKVEPHIVIPMHYKIPGLTLPLEAEKAFCDAMGNCPKQTLARLNIKKKDLENKLMEVVLLERGV